MLRDMVSYGIHMVHAWTIEINSRVEGMTSGHMYMACCVVATTRSMFNSSTINKSHRRNI